MATGYLDEVTHELQRLKITAEKAVAQVDRADLFRTLDAEGNSIAVIMKHLAGSLRSRWTDIFTTDGEKPDRHRDGEFVVGEADTREALLARWEGGWKALFDALAALGPADLDRTVLIRSQPHTVLQAVNRSLSHCASHVGQIVLLAKHFAGPRWQTLSIPRGQSEQFTAALRAKQGAG